MMKKSHDLDLAQKRAKVIGARLFALYWAGKFGAFAFEFLSGVLFYRHDQALRKQV